MANFLMIWCVGGKAAFVPFVLQEQSVDLFENSNCNCAAGSGVLLKAGAELAAGVPEIWRCRICACIFMVWDFIKSQSRCWSNILVGFFYCLFVRVFFLFNQQAALPFITVGVFFYFKF